MNQHKCINPDDYLETDTGRIWSYERSNIAWEKAYGKFEAVLQQISKPVEVVIVYGVQGAGKSYWINGNMKFFQQPTIFFDAALPAAKHREKIITIARLYSNKITGVLIKVSLEVAFKQNKNRTLDKQIPEQTIRNVYRQIQAATLDEGFTNLITINT